MITNSNWITGGENSVFKKAFDVESGFTSATLTITAMGVYEAHINGKRVGDFILAPGWTSYKKRLMYQEYDITDMLSHKNEITVGIGNGWYRGRIAWMHDSNVWGGEPAIIAEIVITYPHKKVNLVTDSTWTWSEGNVRFSEIYDGETYDATYIPTEFKNAEIADLPKSNLIPQEGEIIKEHERISPVEIITTPKGEKVIDFGQNMTGYVELNVDAKAGDKIVWTHAEVLDKDGNFYNDNYRSAKSCVTYICKDGKQTYKPKFSFMGFRYIRLDECTFDVNEDNFTAIVVHSDIKRTGYFECGVPLVNQLYKNVIWGQKGNYLDVPTDCPQRDERLGWTGDAQAFVRAGAYNFDILKFFKKWLHDLAADQRENGSVPHVIPDALSETDSNAFGWADASVICPWQIYLAYGDKTVLEDQFESMKKYVDFQGTAYHIKHFGDWLAMDHGDGSYVGATDEVMINRAFHAYSTSLFIKAGKALGKDMSEYEEKLKVLRQNFVSDYKAFDTQTGHVLALYFDLTDDKEGVAKSLADMIRANGDKLTTGFLGTPYLLHVLSDNGYTELAYNLLLQQEFPSWLYSVTKGATTIWEHWDGIKPDGSFWSKDMNSYNHYAYGAVADWMYGVSAGILPDEEKPGYENVILKPLPDKRMGYVKASLDTKYGTVSSEWRYVGDKVEYKFYVPNKATIVINNESLNVGKGEYTFTM